MRLEELEGDVLAERFRLEQMIGQGGYGAVFEATQLSVGRRCAVKIMLPARSTNEAVEKRFRAEARATSRLTHPNSLVLYDFGVDEKTGFLFLATEFLDGCTLHEVLEREKTLEIKRAVSIMKQTAASLQDAHSLGLVHRDIKPKNIMLIERAGKEDFVKVIDFGIAKALRGQLSRETDLTRTGMMIGTPQYMAPEQILGRELDGRVDQYVLAVVGYRMLTGRNPFRAGAPMETAMRHVNDRVLPLRTYRPELEVTAEFEDAFLRALEKSPEYRFARVIDFVEALEDTLGECGRGAQGRPERQQGSDRQGGSGGECAEEDTAETAAFALSGMGHPTEKLGAVLKARAGGKGKGAKTLFDSDEEERETVMYGKGEEAKAVGAQGPGQSAQALFKEESTMPMPLDEGRQRSASREQLSTEQLVDRQSLRERSGQGGVPIWAVLLVSMSLIIFSAAVVIVLISSGEPSSQTPSDRDESGAVQEPAQEIDEEVAQQTDEEEPQASAVIEQSVLRGKQRVDGAVTEGREEAAQLEEQLEKKAAQARAAADSRPARPRQGTVTVTLIPWGTLYVDGREISDRTRQEVTLAEGRHELTLRQRGEVRARQVVDVRGGHSKMVVLEAEFDSP